MFSMNPMGAYTGANWMSGSSSGVGTSTGADPYGLNAMMQGEAGMTSSIDQINASSQLYTQAQTAQMMQIVTTSAGASTPGTDPTAALTSYLGTGDPSTSSFGSLSSLMAWSGSNTTTPTSVAGVSNFSDMPSMDVMSPGIAATMGMGEAQMQQDATLNAQVQAEANTVSTAASAESAVGGISSLGGIIGGIASLF